MHRTRHPRAALAAFVAVATLAAGCGAPDQSAPPNASSTPIPTVASSRSQTVSPPTPPNDGHGGRGGSGIGSAAAAGGLPADWPPELPVPQGSIVGSTGSAGRWTVLILAAGSAAEVRRSTVALYSRGGLHCHLGLRFEQRESPDHPGSGEPGPQRDTDQPGHRCDHRLRSPVACEHISRSTARSPSTSSAIRGDRLVRRVVSR